MSPLGGPLHASTYHIEVMPKNRWGIVMPTIDQVLMLARPASPRLITSTTQMITYPHEHSVLYQWLPPTEDGDGSDASLPLTYQVRVDFGDSSLVFAMNSTTTIDV